MGCDIHMIAEIEQMSGGSIMYFGGIKTHIMPKNYWHKLNRVFLNQHFDPTENRIGYFNDSDPLSDEPWHDRWYLLFAKLAGVRNVWELEPLAEPKGIPSDADDDTREWILEHADHSHSYFTLDELKKFDWDKPFLLEKEWVSLSKFSTVIDQLSTIAKGMKLEPNQIRIVFGFDN